MLPLRRLSLVLLEHVNNRPTGRRLFSSEYLEKCFKSGVLKRRSETIREPFIVEQM